MILCSADVALGAGYARDLLSLGPYTLPMNQYWVDSAANSRKTLYTGVTGDLKLRMYRHKHRLAPGFTSKYRIGRLVFFESTADVRAAIAREKQIKGWRREKKIQLIESVNPKWEDLSEKF